MKTSLIFLFIACLASLTYSVNSQSADVETNLQNAAAQDLASSANTKPLQKQPSPKTGGSTLVGWLSSFELWLSLSVLIFGLIALFVEIAVIKSGGFKPDDSIKLMAVTLIVISTLFIITAGFDSEQIAPAMGLFGTVAGYMLGKTTPIKEG